MKIAIFLTLILSLQTTGFALSLGEKLVAKRRPDGSVAVGFTYSTPTDPNGANYFFTIAPQVPAATANKMVKVNLWDATTQTVLKDWNTLQAVPFFLIQVRESDTAIVAKLLTGQGHADQDVLFVVSDDNGKTISHSLSVAEYCAIYPEHFKDLTNGNRCNQN